MRYSKDKISYYKTLGKYHIDDVDDSSTEYSESSDDFPSPSPIKKRRDERRDRGRDKDREERRDRRERR